ncbi:MAG: tetratricopeptide repeat protein, partial [Pirellulaceae bacterium]
DFDQALEGYVTLAATYPKSPLIASCMIRISDYFYKKKEYQIASQVGEKFLEKFPGHEHNTRMAFRVGQSYYKAEKYGDSGDAFDAFVKRFPEDKLTADALFWAGESYRQGKDNQLAFRRYNRCHWDFPSSEAAKYARGRLALPEMINQFEQEAASLDQ